ncbi:hypothetical protein [Algibacter mikhailovii]|nr:hypothetical protein [Algibacter mikhailovii]
MKKVLKGIVFVIVLFFVISKGLEWWLESSFESKINKNPERSYDITYEDFDLDNFFTGVTLTEMKIEPLNAKAGSVVTGRVDHATLNGLVWIDLLVGRRLNMQEIAFVKPVFKVEIGKDSTKNKGGKGLQTMFGDILSRADLKSFSLEKGSVMFLNSETQDTIGQVKNIDILATELETDALQFNHLIPFKMGDINVDIRDGSFQLNDYTFMNLGHFHYNLKNKEILLKEVALGYNKSWVEVSREIGFQNDVIEFDVKEIGIHQLEPSSEFYTQLDIDAGSVSIDGLNIKLQRNKNLQRPADTTKPMFQGMINAIPVDLKLDSLSISNSTLAYGELGLKKLKTGYITIGDINGSVTGITNKEDHQAVVGSLHANIKATLENKAGLNLVMDAPYSNETFQVDLDVDDMKFTDFNSTLKPLVGVEMLSGYIQKIKYHMEANSVYSNNHLVFDYKDLNLEVLKEEDTNEPKRRVFQSAIANAAIHPSNMPGDKKYSTAAYSYQRNIYRSPINYIIHGLIEGFTYIVPKKGIQNLLHKKKKPKKN